MSNFVVNGGAQPNTLYGMRLVVTPDRPKMQLSARVCEVLAPDFVAETNAWMLEFFGWTNVLDDGVVIVSRETDAVFVNPRTFVALRDADAAWRSKL